MIILIIWRWCSLLWCTCCAVIIFRSWSTSSASTCLIILFWSSCSSILFCARFRCSTLIRCSSASVIISIRFSDTIVIRFYFSILIRRRRYSSASTIFTCLITLSRSTSLRCVLTLLISTRFSTSVLTSSTLSSLIIIFITRSS